MEMMAVMAVLGALFGSFLNVCISRLPQEESIVFPGSRCPHCKKPVAWHDNIPLFSYLFLGAKCRSCRKPIAIRYFIVELVSAAMWPLLWMTFGLSWIFAAAVIYFSILFAVSVTDLETGLIPDKFTFFGMGAGLVLSSIHPGLHGQSVWYLGLLRSAVGLLAGGGFILGAGYLGNWLFKKESMGGGDIKLLALIGAFLGAKKAIFIFFFAPFFALPIALAAKFIYKAETIPYGPYLAAAGACFFIWGDVIIKAIFPYF